MAIFWGGAGRLLLALARLLQGIREARILILRLHLLEDLHYQQIPARQLARSLSLGGTTSLSHSILMAKNFFSPPLEQEPEKILQQTRALLP